MSLSLRFILPLFAALSLITYASLGLVDRLMENWFIRDVETRAALITNTLAEPIDEALKTKDSTKKNRRPLPPRHARRAPLCSRFLR